MDLVGSRNRLTVSLARWTVPCLCMTVLFTRWRCSVLGIIGADMTCSLNLAAVLSVLQCASLM